jgi:hypothetical protein
MEMFYSIDELSKELASFSLFQSFFLENEFKKFSLGDILHHQKKLFRGLYDFVKLDYVGMTNLLQNMNFTGDSLNIGHITDLALFEHFDCYFFSCEGVDPKFNFSEGPFSEVAGEDVVADGAATLKGGFSFPFSHDKFII